MCRGPGGCQPGDKGRAGEEQRTRGDPCDSRVGSAVPGFPQCFGAKLLVHPINPPDLSTCKLYPQAGRAPLSGVCSPGLAAPLPCAWGEFEARIGGRSAAKFRSKHFSFWI